MPRKPVKDVFGLWQIDFLGGAGFRGKYEIPYVHGTSQIPESLVPFSKCKNETDCADKAVHFYEYDEKFAFELESEDRFTKLLEMLRKYKCVILPDFSVYRDLPLAVQINQVYKSRAAGAFLEHNGIKVIPNIRWGDERSYEFAFEGVEQWGIVSVGVQGAYRDKENAYFFEKGFLKMLDVIDPETVLCYGKVSREMEFEAEQRKIRIKTYPTEISRRIKVDEKKQTELF